MKFNNINYKKYISWICLMVLVILFSVANSRFRTIDNAINIFRQVSIDGILAIGLSFVMISGGIDLSQGPLLGFTGTLCGMLIVESGMSFFPAAVIAVLAATLFGLFNGVSITVTNMPPIISTLGMSYVVRGCAYLIHDGMPVRGFPEYVGVMGQGYLGPIPIPVVLFIVLAMIAAFILSKTTYGRYVYAMGSNREAARLTGIKIGAIQTAVYTISSMLAGFGGCVMMSRMNAGQPGVGQNSSLDIVVGVVLGGVSASGGEGTMLGMIGGVLLMGVLSNGMTIMGLNDYFQLLMRGLVLIAAVGFDYYGRTRAAMKKAHVIQNALETSGNSKKK